MTKVQHSLELGLAVDSLSLVYHNGHYAMAGDITALYLEPGLSISPVLYSSTPVVPFFSVGLKAKVPLFSLGSLGGTYEKGDVSVVMKEVPDSVNYSLAGGNVFAQVGLDINIPSTDFTIRPSFHGGLFGGLTTIRPTDSFTDSLSGEIQNQLPTERELSFLSEEDRKKVEDDMSDIEDDIQDIADGKKSPIGLAEIGGGISFRGRRFGLDVLVKKYIFPNGIVDGLSVEGWGGSVAGSVSW